MKKITLVLAMCMAAITVHAQTTFDLDWAIGINGSAASVTIEPGDTVRWTWTDAAPHTVTNISGQSVENFDSGTLTGNGEVFSFTFNTVGENDYRCEVHPGTMFGTISVETIASVDEKFRMNIQAFPNPVKDQLTIASLFKLDSYSIHNVLGKKVAASNESGNLVNIDMASLNQGVYFVTLTSEGLETTIQVVKQ
jgi:plastocyanin